MFVYSASSAIGPGRVLRHDGQKLRGCLIQANGNTILIQNTFIINDTLLEGLT